MSGKLDALFQQARRAGGTDRAKVVEDAEPIAKSGDEQAATAARHTDRLMLIEGRDGRLRYLLDGEEVRVGDEVEVFVNADNGWLYGTFQWTGRERHAPSLKIQLKVPGDAVAVAGELDAVLPKHARVRRA
ncbi:MAG: hypothetical protein AB8H79_11870 [Myxococcota bacterium]